MSASPRATQEEIAMPHRLISNASCLASLWLCSALAEAQAFPIPPAPPPAATSVPAESAATAAPAMQAEFARLGCRAESVVELGHVYYAACANAAVWAGESDAQGVLHISEMRTTGAPVRVLYVRGDALWVETSDELARPFARLPPAAPSVQTPPPSAASKPARVGQVVQVNTDRLTITLGKQDGLQVGDHIEVFVAPTSAEDREFDLPAERVLVGQVVAVSDARARVAMGLCEDAREGMSARYTYDPLSASSNSPPRTPGLLLIEGALRPFLPLKPVSFGALGDLAVTYLANIPMYLRLELRPIGGRIGSDHGDGVFAGFASVGYDHTYFSLGIGVGTLYQSKFGEIATSPGDTEHLRDTRFALGTLLNVRLGSRDGVNATLTTTFALRSNEWEFGFIDLTGQAPVGSRSWLTGGLGGGAGVGYLYVELGFRRLIMGNGAGGSLFIRPTVGVAGIDQRRPGSDSGNFAAGPMVGLHVEGRLAP
jgi:hypothetical protein